METTVLLFTLVICADGSTPVQPTEPAGDPRFVISKQVCADGSSPRRSEMKFMSATPAGRNIVEITDDGELRFRLAWDGQVTAAPGFIADPLAVQFWTYLRDAYTSVCEARR